jgi:hypothetical protein
VHNSGWARKSNAGEIYWGPNILGLSDTFHFGGKTTSVTLVFNSGKPQNKGKNEGRKTINHPQYLITIGYGIVVNLSIVYKAKSSAKGTKKKIHHPPNPTSNQTSH